MTFEDSIKQLKSIANKVQESPEILASEFLTDANDYIPFETGDLKRSSILHSDLKIGIVIWQTPYARKLFYNPQYNFSKNANSKASGLWAEKAKRINEDKYKKIATKTFEEVKKDVIK